MEAGQLRGYHGAPSSNILTHVQFPETPGLQPLHFMQVSCTFHHVLAVINGSTDNNDVPWLVRARMGVPIASASPTDYTSLTLIRSVEMWSSGKGLALGHGGGRRVAAAASKGDRRCALRSSTSPLVEASQLAFEEMVPARAMA